MLRKNDGFFLVELLLSFATWLIALGILLPLVIQVTNQSIQLELEKTATHILYDELEKRKIVGNVVNNKTVNRNGVTYEVEWRTTEAKLEVCIVFQNAKHSNCEKCQIFE
jgi:competence protein ComGE